jgi:hypothetical protein
VRALILITGEKKKLLGCETDSVILFSPHLRVEGHNMLEALLWSLRAESRTMKLTQLGSKKKCLGRLMCSESAESCIAAALLHCDDRPNSNFDCAIRLNGITRCIGNLSAGSSMGSLWNVHAVFSS